jgi:hypothetical protein
MDKSADTTLMSNDQTQDVFTRGYADVSVDSANATTTQRSYCVVVGEITLCL